MTLNFQQYFPKSSANQHSSTTNQPLPAKINVARNTPGVYNPTLRTLALNDESESRSVMSDSLRSHGLHSPWNSPGQNAGVGSLSLLQGIFPTQGSNPGLSHCIQILYHLSHKGSPRILEWVTYPSPADLPDPGIELGSPVLQADSLPTELSGKPFKG